MWAFRVSRRAAIIPFPQVRWCIWVSPLPRRDRPGFASFGRLSSRRCVARTGASKSQGWFHVPTGRGAPSPGGASWSSRQCDSRDPGGHNSTAGEHNLGAERRKPDSSSQPPPLMTNNLEPLPVGIERFTALCRPPGRHAQDVNRPVQEPQKSTGFRMAPGDVGGHGNRCCYAYPLVR